MNDELFDEVFDTSFIETEKTQVDFIWDTKEIEDIKILARIIKENVNSKKIHDILKIFNDKLICDEIIINRIAQYSPDDLEDTLMSIIENLLQTNKKSKNVYLTISKAFMGIHEYFYKYILNRYSSDVVSDNYVECYVINTLSKIMGCHPESILLSLSLTKALFEKTSCPSDENLKVFENLKFRLMSEFVDIKILNTNEIEACLHTLDITEKMYLRILLTVCFHFYNNTEEPKNISRNVYMADTSDKFKKLINDPIFETLNFIS